MHVYAKGVYHQRHPEKTAPYRIFDRHYDEFKQVYEEKYQTRYGFFRHIVDEAVFNYLRCGIPKHGFARVKCADCKNEYILPFSCKSRLCPSCNNKRMHELELFLVDEILQLVPHRHLVFTLPKILRPVFIRNRKSLNDLSRIAWHCTKRFMQKTLNRKSDVPGAVSVIQTHGSMCNPNSHVHSIISDGLFSGTGTFYQMPKYDTKAKTCLRKIFEKKIISYCLKNNFISPDNANRILSQRYSGFSVYVDTTIRYTKYADEEEVQKMRHMLRYISKSFYSIERTVYKDDARTVLYKGQYHPGFKRNFEMYSPTDFIAAVTAHIPNRYQKYTLYYGQYSSRTRGKIRKENELEETAHVMEIVEPDDIQKKYHKNWAILIQKVFEVDPLACPKCQGRMRVISVIEEDAVIEKILGHLGQWVSGSRAPPSDQSAEEYIEDEIKREPFDDGWKLAETAERYIAA